MRAVDVERERRANERMTKVSSLALSFGASKFQSFALTTIVACLEQITNVLEDIRDRLPRVETK
jgi:hypothetical protein